jgi:hypothetical protein
MQNVCATCSRTRRHWPWVACRPPQPEDKVFLQLKKVSEHVFEGFGVGDSMFRRPQGFARLGSCHWQDTVSWFAKTR